MKTGHTATPVGCGHAARMVGIGAAMHFMVDGLCLCCLYLLAASSDAESLLSVFVSYNLLAFLTQPLTGLWADHLQHRHWMVLASVLLLTAAVLAAVVVATVPGLLSSAGGTLVVATLLGTGNSLFHVWGGRQTVEKAGNDPRALGVFVSTGALGLAVSMVSYSWALLCALLLAVCVLAAAYVWLDGEAGFPHRTAPLPTAPLRPSLAWAALGVLMAAVMLRSFAGECFSAAVPHSPFFVVLLGATSMLGKMAGGWIGRRLGVVVSLAVLVLLASVAWLCRCWGLPSLLAGLFFVNCTMPLTLYLANAALPGREALAFGLLAAALMPGYLLATL